MKGYEIMNSVHTVLITGASSGIGKAMVKYLSASGYRVVLVARHLGKLQEVVGEISGESLCIPYDLQDLCNIENIFKKCSENGIKLYGMVHCAGINRDQPVKTNNLNDMIEVMNLNLMSFIELAKYFYKRKYSEDGGAIVAMSSMAAFDCAKGMCTYSASKAGVDAAVQVMSKEFAKRKIRVNSIQPSFVNTPMARMTVNYEAKFNAQPLGVIEPQYIAYLAGFLLSDEAKYISGSNIKVSAGV